MRTSHIELPTYDELRSILDHEGSREVTPSKEKVHYGDFSTILNLLDEYKLPKEFFQVDLSFSDYSNKALYDDVVRLFSELSEEIKNTSNEESKIGLFYSLYDYLSETDEQEQADIIFVFGSKNTFRIETAIKLFNEGLAPKILISGRGPHYELQNNELAEAEVLGQFALEQGVTKKSLIIESESITTPDNVKRSLNKLEQLEIPHNKIILVNSPFSQRRGWAHFKKFTDENTKLVRVNVDQVSSRFSRDGWFKDETGIKTIIKEFYGLRMSQILNTS